MYVEPLITKAKDDSTHSRRIVFSYLQNKEAVSELFREVSGKIAERPGGYTRILKTGTRLGDNADMCIIELVDYNENLLASKSAKAKSTTRRSRRGGKKTTTEVPETAEKAVEKTEEVKAEEIVKDEAPEVVAEETKEEVVEAKAEEVVEEKKEEPVKEEKKKKRKKNQKKKRKKNKIFLHKNIEKGGISALFHAFKLNNTEINGKNH